MKSGKRPSLHLYLVATMLLLWAGILPAQLRIEIPNSRIKPGPVVEIDVLATIPETNVTSFRLYLSYDPSYVVFHGVVTDGETLMQCAAPVFDTNETATFSAVLEIDCAQISPGEGVLCRLQVEGLRGPDTVTTLRPDSVFVNGVQTPDNIFRDGLITLTDRIIIPQDAERLLLTAPNPFTIFTEVKFALAQDNTEVRFAVFNAFGQLIFEDLVVGDRGQNSWFFDPSANELFVAQGVYLLLMETANGVYTRPFQILH